MFELISGTRTRHFIFILEFAYCPKVIKSGIRGFALSEDCVCLKFYRSSVCVDVASFFPFFPPWFVFTKSCFPWFLSIFALDQLNPWHLRLHSLCPLLHPLHSNLAKKYRQRFPLTRGLWVTKSGWLEGRVRVSPAFSEIIFSFRYHS